MDSQEFIIERFQVDIDSGIWKICSLNLSLITSGLIFVKEILSSGFLNVTTIFLLKQLLNFNPDPNQGNPAGFGSYYNVQLSNIESWKNWLEKTLSV